ncbi:MAG TPA: 3-phosphoshikimate 1-carboxyvinyltransferase, partial [Gammaproteobacteria bacterium]|nr:3-phosphoshikimate 1-carboxyvinyltransferase [Gammaproteobacteria bacterium]
ASICKRPMRRVIIPLTQMGAKITAEQDEFAPLQIVGGQKLQAINYVMPIASAQVKSAILLADLYAGGTSRVMSPQTCRDHTEIMLQYFAQETVTEINLNIPGDLSAAAFFMVGACITPGADILLCNVGINPTRAAVLEILCQMGAEIACENVRQQHGELRADLRVRYTRKLRAIEFPTELVANAIDEIPILCLAAACAEGTTVIRGASELRHKESDRISMLAQGFTKLGIEVNEFSDGLAITGGVISGGEVASGGDHRIAMTFAMAGLVAQHAIIVQDTAHIATSFPGFVQVAQQAGMQIEELIPCPM